MISFFFCRHWTLDSVHNVLTSNWEKKLLSLYIETCSSAHQVAMILYAILKCFYIYIWNVFTFQQTWNIGKFKMFYHTHTHTHTHKNKMQIHLIQERVKAVPSFIFVSRPREGRFLAFHEEKKTKKIRFFLRVCFFSWREGRFLVKNRTGNKNKTWNGLIYSKSGISSQSAYI